MRARARSTCLLSSLRDALIYDGKRATILVYDETFGVDERDRRYAGDQTGDSR